MSANVHRSNFNKCPPESAADNRLPQTIDRQIFRKKNFRNNSRSRWTISIGPPADSVRHGQVQVSTACGQMSSSTRGHELVRHSRQMSVTHGQIFGVMLGLGSGLGSVRVRDIFDASVHSGKFIEKSSAEFFGGLSTQANNCLQVISLKFMRKRFKFMLLIFDHP